MIELREYQKNAIEKIREEFGRGVKKVLLVSPTGSGKTTIFSEVVRGAYQKKKRVCLVAHRKELLAQISNRLHLFGVPHTLDVEDESHSIFVASIFTINKRKTNNFDLIVVDEAHHSCAKNWDEFLDKNKGSFVLGVSATPCRLDGKGLKSAFDSLIECESVAWMIKNKFLCDFRIFIPNLVDFSKLKGSKEFSRDSVEALFAQSKVFGDVIANYEKHANGKKAIVFCANVSHAQKTKEAFLKAGHAADVILGEQSDKERDEVVKKFSVGSIRILISVDVISEGFDIPDAEVAILLRPTKSLSLFLQQIGRVLRPSFGKNYAIILDHANNSLRHGLPDDEFEWSLEGGVKKKKKNVEMDISTRLCPACLSVHRPAKVCPFCGHEHVIKGKKLKENPSGELVEMTKEDFELIRKKEKAEQSQARTLNDLINLGVNRGYKNPKFWAMKIMEARGR